MIKTRQRSTKTRTVSENLQLRRENSRLRKQIQRLNGAVNNLTWKGFESEEDSKGQQETPLKGKDCPKCGDQTGEVMLGRFTFLFCSGCDYRERKSGA